MEGGLGAAGELPVDPHQRLAPGAGNEVVACDVVVVVARAGATRRDDLAEALAQAILRIKPLICNDPPECEIAKCELFEKKLEENDIKV